LQHARLILQQAERLREDLRACGPDQGAFQHQCVDRVPARGA
jgi:hypothetical protein